MYVLYDIDIRKAIIFKMGCNGSKIGPQAVVPQEVPQAAECVPQVIENVKKDPLHHDLDAYHIVWINKVNHSGCYYTTMYKVEEEAAAEARRLNAEATNENIVYGYRCSYAHNIAIPGTKFYSIIMSSTNGYTRICCERSEQDAIKTLNRKFYNCYVGILRV